MKGHFWRKEWEDSLCDLNQWGRVGGQRSQMIRPEHQIFNDPPQQMPERLFKAALQTEPELDFPLRFKILVLWRTLTGSDGLFHLGHRHWLLYVRDHQVGCGEELVCGHHQPDCTAAHHHVLCWVSSCVCMILGDCPKPECFFLLMWFWSLPFLRFESVSFVF